MADEEDRLQRHKRVLHFTQPVDRCYPKVAAQKGGPPARSLTSRNIGLKWRATLGRVKELVSTGQIPGSPWSGPMELGGTASWQHTG